jgi:hypothetical protein
VTVSLLPIANKTLLLVSALSRIQPQKVAQFEIIGEITWAEPNAVGKGVTRELLVKRFRG